MTGPQTVLYARTIYTLAQEHPASALGITDGRISHVGTKEQAQG